MIVTADETQIITKLRKVKGNLIPTSKTERAAPLLVPASVSGLKPGATVWMRQQQYQHEQSGVVVHYSAGVLQSYKQTDMHRNSSQFLEMIVLEKI